MVYYTAGDKLNIKEKHMRSLLYASTALACTMRYKTIWGKNGIQSYHKY